MTEPGISILQRSVYGIAEAAGLLGLRPDRVRAWVEGYERQGVRYAPVIRAEPTGDEVLTWGEFVELGYLREYRRNRVPLQRLRPVIDELRREFRTPYPLATARPYVYDKELVLDLQERNDLPPSIAIVISTGQTIALATGAQRFFRKVEFDPPRRWRCAPVAPRGRHLAGGDRSPRALRATRGQRRLDGAARPRSPGDSSSPAARANPRPRAWPCWRSAGQASRRSSTLGPKGPGCTA